MIAEVGKTQLTVGKSKPTRPFKLASERKKRNAGEVMRVKSKQSFAKKRKCFVARE